MMDRDIVRFFGKHLVAIDIAFKPTRKFPPKKRFKERIFLSATLIDLNGVLFLLTAGHCLEEVREVAESGLEISSSQIIDTFGDQIKVNLPIPFHLNPDSFLFVHDDEYGLDFGLIPVRPIFEKLLLANGVEILTEERWIKQPQLSFDFFAVLGLPDEFNKIDHNGTTRHETTLLFLEEVKKPPADLADKKYERFFGTFEDLGDIKSLKGMSGGPIIGFKRGEKMQYWLVGIQSGCRKHKNLIFGTKISEIARFHNNAIAASAA
ncbi:MAG: hypothetical protein DHS20C05_16230 [Hyphococcus sp.]|nr:MAG: hypothetical protein DHS20C05_16230 [Marinicaulis sp.]